MKRSVNLSRSAAGDRRNTGKHLVEAMRALGMTDAQIAAALEQADKANVEIDLGETPSGAAAGESVSTASGEPVGEQPELEQVRAADCARPGGVS